MTVIAVRGNLTKFKKFRHFSLTNLNFKKKKYCQSFEFQKSLDFPMRFKNFEVRSKANQN